MVLSFLFLGLLVDEAVPLPPYTHEHTHKVHDQVTSPASQEEVVPAFPADVEVSPGIHHRISSQHQSPPSLNQEEEGSSSTTMSQLQQPLEQQTQGQDQDQRRGTVGLSLSTVTNPLMQAIGLITSPPLKVSRAAVHFYVCFIPYIDPVCLPPLNCDTLSICHLYSTHFSQHLHARSLDRNHIIMNQMKVKSGEYTK